MNIAGESLIAGASCRGLGAAFRVLAPATMEYLEPEFGTITEADADRAARAAIDAFDAYRQTTPDERARFLRAIADNLENARTSIVDRATKETGLPAGRIEVELTRTVGQLRLFAEEVLLGEHQGVRIDHALPDRQPLPGPDVRQRQIPLGPVLVFGASNFPLAFSVAGGDTASALAAGCPVIVKAHSSHAGTAELAGRAIVDAVAECGLPPGTFSMVFGPGPVVGNVLARHPNVKAIAFTGSQAAGTDLMQVAASRPEPIPVYAEMSSINPVIWLPMAAQTDVATRAADFVASLTLGAGQFCTNPGLIFIPESATQAIHEIRDALIQASGQTMLSEKIATSYADGLGRLRSLGIAALAEGNLGQTLNAPRPEIFVCDAPAFLANPGVQEEVFGAAAVIVTYSELDELRSCITALQGQLTATLHFEDEDVPSVTPLVTLLETRVGRIVANGWPTGVEVNHSMVHGGPFPATSDSRTTSVGTLAIWRFQRPVAYQNLQDSLLPTAVRDSNPWNVPRRETPRRT